MPRRDDIVMILGRIDRDGNRARAIMRRNTGCDAFLCLDRDGESGAHAFPIVPGHHVQVQRVRAFLRHRQADQPAPMPGHEVDVFRRYKVGGDNEVSLIFPVLGIHQDVHPAIAGVLDNLVNRGDCAVKFAAHLAYCPSGASAPIIRAT